MTIKSKFCRSSWISAAVPRLGKGTGRLAIPLAPRNQPQSRNGGCTNRVGKVDLSTQQLRTTGLARQANDAMR